MADAGITLVGANHRTAPLDVRERFAHTRTEVPGAVARVVASGARGVVLLSTCNRTEFYLAGAADGATRAVWDLLGARLGDGRAAESFGYVRQDRDAVQHLYRVVAGLDSMVLGEHQIQGQVREAWEASRDAADPILHRLFQSALLVGSRVRSETALGEGEASMATAAAAVAEKIFGDLGGRTALILGAGEVAELAAACLADRGARVTAVANRTYERARELAERLGAEPLALADAWPRLETVDLVISSTAAPHSVVTYERVAGPIGRRAARPLCILDLAVPRDVEPAVTRLANVFLYDVDDLQTAAAQAVARRRAEIPRAERIVEEELRAFWTWHDQRAVVPVVTEFRERLDGVRAAELEKVLSRLPDLTAEERERIEHFSRALLNKFLHEPTRAVKEEAAAGRGAPLVSALRRLFGLDRERS